MIKLYEEFDGGSDRLVFEVALLFKLEDSTKDQIKNIFKSNKETDLLPLPDDKKFITLTSIKGCKPFKDVLKSKLPTDIQAPKIELGKTTIANREAIDTTPPTPAKKSFVVEVKNQEELKTYVNQVYESMGLKNPEPDRYFYITIANNVENKKSPGMADPFASIGDITEKDFSNKPVVEKVTSKRWIKTFENFSRINENTAKGKEMTLNIFSGVGVVVDLVDGVVTNFHGEIERENMYIREDDFEEGLEPFKKAGVKVSYDPWVVQDGDDYAGSYSIDVPSLNDAIKDKKITIIVDPEDPEILDFSDSYI